MLAPLKIEGLDFSPDFLHCWIKGLIKNKDSPKLKTAVLPFTHLQKGTGPMIRQGLSLIVFLLVSACVQSAKLPTEIDREPAGKRARSGHPQISDSNEDSSDDPSEATKQRQAKQGPRPEPSIPEDQENLQKKCAAGLETAPKEIFLNYKAMLVSYSPLFRVANWTRHEIYSDSLERSCAERANKFIADRRLANDFHLTPIVTKDYAKTGYDRGHLAPSADFLWSTEVNSETFFMTNMTPQTPPLNQKAWNSLEGRIRRWACGNGHLKVFTGPVLKPSLPRLASCVAVPEEYFKVILSDKTGDYKAIGFIYSQTDSSDLWMERALPISEVEKRTGLQFFTEFPDDIAKKFKEDLDIEKWKNSETECRACDGEAKPPEK